MKKLIAMLLCLMMIVPAFCVANAEMPTVVMAFPTWTGRPAGADRIQERLSAITEEKLTAIRALNELAKRRGQKLSQMAMQWVLRDEAVTSALIGASRPQQVLDNIEAVNGPAFTQEELNAIDSILKQ